MEKYGWMGRAEAANSFCYICFVWQQKQGWALLGTPGREQVSCEKDYPGLKHTADKVYETISQVLLPALPAGKSLYMSLSKKTELKDTETTDKHVPMWEMVASQASLLKATYMVG